MITSFITAIVLVFYIVVITLITVAYICWCEDYYLIHKNLTKHLIIMYMPVITILVAILTFVLQNN